MKGKKKWLIVVAAAAMLVETLAGLGVVPPVVAPIVRAVVSAVVPELPVEPGLPRAKLAWSSN